MRDKCNNMPYSLLYQVHQIGVVVHGYGLQLLKYCIPGANNDHQDEGYQEFLLASSTAAAIVIRRHGRSSRHCQGRGGTVVGYLVEELVVIAAIVVIAVIVKLVAFIVAGGKCPGGGRGGPAGNVGVVGQRRRLFKLEPEALRRHHRLPRRFFALVSLSSSSIPMAAVDSDSGQWLTASGDNGDSGRRHRTGTMAAVDGGDRHRSRPQQFTPLLIILPSIVALSRRS